MKFPEPLMKLIGQDGKNHAFSHWWLQRLSAVAMIPLTIWFLVSLLTNLGRDYAQVSAWLSSPLNAILMLLFALIGLYHAQTGLQVVIEDYIHTRWVNLMALVFVKFAAVVMAVFAFIAILKLVAGDA